MDRSNGSWCSILLGLLALLVTAGAQAQSGGWSQDQKLSASDGAAGDWFGYSVSLSSDGTGALIGDFVSNGGSAYIYRRDAVSGVWSEDEKLLALDGVVGDAFGVSVSLSSDGSVALVGAGLDDDNGTDSGSAYVYTRDPVTGAWTEEAKLLASDGAADDLFGYSVSLSSDGESALIGAQRDDDNGLDSGSAYVFARDPVTAIWTEEAKLLAPDGAAEDLFAHSVSLSSDGTAALAGAYRDDDNGLESGSAYVFARDPGTGLWTAEAKLLAPDGVANDTFGYSVSLSSNGSAALVGAPGDDGNGSGTGTVFAYAGAAYVYARNPATGAWAGEVKLVASDRAIDDQFGHSVSLSADGTAALAGAPYDDDNGLTSGSAYVFTRNSKGGWTEATKLIAGDGAASDQLGYSLSISSDGALALSGAYGDDDNGAESGSAYLFSGTPPPTVPAIPWVGLLALVLTGMGWMAIRRTRFSEA